MGFNVEKQKKNLVYYFGHIVGDYSADLLVNELIDLELKSNECIVEANENQLINYLKATTLEVGLLLNFRKKPEVRRKSLITDRKTIKLPKV